MCTLEQRPLKRGVFSPATWKRNTLAQNGATTRSLVCFSLERKTLGGPVPALFLLLFLLLLLAAPAATAVISAAAPISSAFPPETGRGSRRRRGGEAAACVLRRSKALRAARERKRRRRTASTASAATTCAATTSSCSSAALAFAATTFARRCGLFQQRVGGEPRAAVAPRRLRRRHPQQVHILQALGGLRAGTCSRQRAADVHRPSRFKCEGTHAHNTRVS
jgi:hypothetical protein